MAAVILCIVALSMSGLLLSIMSLWLRARVSDIESQHRDCLQRLTALELVLLDRFPEGS